MDELKRVGVGRWISSWLLALALFSAWPQQTMAADFAFWDLLTDAGGDGSQLPPRMARMPNFMGGFFARGGQVTLPLGVTPPSTQIVNLPPNIQQYTFTARDSVIIESVVGPNSQGIFQSINYTGPNGFTFTPPGIGNPSEAVLTQGDISGLMITGVGQVIPLAENAGFTNAVVALFPGAQFVSGSATLEQSFPPFPHSIEEGDSFLNSFLYQVVTPGGTTTVNVPGSIVLGTLFLPNPAGGGMAGRINYFESGSALLRDRVYFFYNGAFNFQALGRQFTINRYTLGGEVVLLDQTMSVELRLPMAGIPSVSQTIGSPVTELDRFTFGNLGLLTKFALYWSETLAITAGLGLSLPTAPSTSVTTPAGAPLIQVRNETVLLQPILALAWAPTERFYLQMATQMDLDPAGNPVYAALNANGLQQVGRFSDRNYWYAQAAGGYWLYLDSDPQALLNGVALQGELSYFQSMGGHGTFQLGQIGLAPLPEGANTLNLSLGLNLWLGNQASVTAGVSAPIVGQRPYDWSALLQVNWFFGAP